MTKTDSFNQENIIAKHLLVVQLARPSDTRAVVLPRQVCRVCDSLELSLLLAAHIVKTKASMWCLVNFHCNDATCTVTLSNTGSA
eukprot:41813-Eustigmatos_ZCMA.PRE.1